LSAVEVGSPAAHHIVGEGKETAGISRAIQKLIKPV